MKKILFALCLFFALPFLSSEAAFALAPRITDIPKPSVTPTPGPVEYTLPYPGILPTHPLYMIKLLRDRIIEMLITDPLSKSEFYILQADKKLNMAISLTSAKKTKEADEALSESLSAREQALTLLGNYKKSGSTIPGHLSEKFFLSLEKHNEVLRDLGNSPDTLISLKTKAEKSLRTE